MPPTMEQATIFPNRVIRELDPAPNIRRSDRLMSFFSAGLQIVHQELHSFGMDASIWQLRDHGVVVSSCLHDQLVSQLFPSSSTFLP